MIEKNWYALRSKPSKEVALCGQVKARKIEFFNPQYRTNAVNPRAAKERPYFPGYLFVNVDIKEHGVSTFQWMPYSLGLVGFDGEPGLLPDALMDALKKRLSEIEEKGGLRHDRLSAGTPLRIVAGPFKGYDAIFDTRLDGEDRVRVLLQLINRRQMPIEMQAGQIAQKT